MFPSLPPSLPRPYNHPQLGKLDERQSWEPLPSQSFTTVWLRDFQTILLPFWGVSASTQFLLYSERDVEKKANLSPHAHSLPKASFISGHGVEKQQPYPCLQRPYRLLLASYPLPFSREAGFVLQRWVSVNVVCSLVTVLKPLMTLTRSSSSTYCKEGKKKHVSQSCTRLKVIPSLLFPPTH